MAALLSPAAILMPACTGDPGDRSAARAAGDRAPIILATTTSIYDTGLLDLLIDRFEAADGRRVKVIAVGSGKALALGERGEADVLLVHSPDAEERFMRAGAGRSRRRMMYNDFILVGPRPDPAGAARSNGDVLSAMRAIAGSEAGFVSRGDESGTHRMEMGLWERLAMTPRRGGAYLETGQGMAATLRVASEKRMYTLTDRGTYLAQRNGIDLEVVCERDPLLRNVYHVIVVDPGRGPRVNLEGAVALERFLLSDDALGLVREFGRERFGRPLFVPDPGPGPIGRS